MTFNSTLCALSIVACTITAQPLLANDNADLDMILGDKTSLSDLKVNRTIFQQTNPELDGVEVDGHTVRYLHNRRALVGSGCNVNRMFDVVSVGSGGVNFENLTNEDLNDACDFINVADVNVTITGPIVGIVDSRHYYGKGTKAGFCVVSTGSSKVLSLDLIKLLNIVFYRNGVDVGHVAVSDGQSAVGLDLSLVKIQGTDDQASMTFVAEAPDVFDEVALESAGGLNLSVGDGYRVKYAFVGDSNIYPLTRDGKNWYKPTIFSTVDESYIGGITKINDKNPHRQIKIEQASVSSSNIESSYHNLVDDESKGVGIKVGAVIEAGGDCMLNMNFTDPELAASGEQVFPAGTNVSFHLTGADVLNVTLGENDYIEFYTNEVSRKGTPGIADTYVDTERIPLTAKVLQVGLVSVGNSEVISATATRPFSGMKLSMGSVGLGVGGTEVKYISVTENPELNHRCDITTDTKVFVDDEATEVTLSAKPGLDLTWHLVSVPEGSEAAIDASTGRLYNLDKPGEYVVKAQVNGDGHEDCNTLISVHNNMMSTINTKTGHCGIPVINNPIAGEDLDNDMVFVPSDKIYDTSGALLSVSDKQDLENIVDANINNFATYTGGLGIANDVMITGVKAQWAPDTEHTETPVLTDGTEAKRLGFVVEESVNGLNAKLLQFFQIRTYYQGTKTSQKPIDESNVVSADVIGTDGGLKRVRYSVEVPKGVLVDEFQLWKSGVLDLNISELKVYYPFIEEANSECSSILGCGGELLNQQATVLPVTSGAGVNVGSTVQNLSHLIDDDLESYTLIHHTVNAGNGVTIRVDLGKTVHPTHQIGIITDNKTYTVGIGLGGWLTLRLLKKIEDEPARAPRKEGEASEPAETTLTSDGKYRVIKEVNEWGVADVNVAGYGDKNALYACAAEPIDAVEITSAGILNVDTQHKLYGICTRGDQDGNGIPDCYDQDQNLVAEPPIHTGIETINNTSGVVISTRPGVVTVTTAEGKLDRVIVFDIKGHAIDAAAGNGSRAELTLPEGYYLIEALLTDGTARTLKIKL